MAPKRRAPSLTFDAISSRDPRQPRRLGGGIPARQTDERRPLREPPTRRKVAMRTPAVITVLLVLVSWTAGTASAESDVAGPGTDIPRLAAELSDYWRATLGSRVQSYQGPRAIFYYDNPTVTPC